MSIISAVEYGILRLTISRPARRNTISGDMFCQIADLLDAAADDPKVRVVLLKGGEDIFSAGADLKKASRRRK